MTPSHQAILFEEPSLPTPERKMCGRRLVLNATRLKTDETMRMNEHEIDRLRNSRIRLTRFLATPKMLKNVLASVNDDDMVLRNKKKKLCVEKGTMLGFCL